MGEMEIIIRAVANFRLDKFHYQKEGKLYPCGEVRFLEGDGDAIVSESLMERFREHLGNSDNPDAELLALQRAGVYELAAMLNFSDVQKMDFTSLADIEAKEKYLMNYLRYLELLQEQESHVYQNLYLN